MLIKQPTTTKIIVFRRSAMLRAWQAILNPKNLI